MALPSCAAAPLPPLMIPVADSLRSCAPADVGPMQTVGDLGGLAIRQEAAFQVCNAKRQALADTIDAHNSIIVQAQQPRRWWWPFGGGN